MITATNLYLPERTAQRMDPNAGWILGGQVLNTEYNIDHGTHVLNHPQQFGMSKAQANQIRKIKNFADQYKQVKEFMFGKGAVRFWYQPAQAVFEVPQVNQQYLSIVQNQLQSTPPGADLTVIEGYYDGEIREGETEQFAFGAPSGRPSIRDIPGATYPKYAFIVTAQPQIVSWYDDKDGYMTFNVRYPNNDTWEYKVPHSKAARVLDMPVAAGGRAPAFVKKWSVSERKLERREAKVGNTIDRFLGRQSQAQAWSVYIVDMSGNELFPGGGDYFTATASDPQEALNRVIMNTGNEPEEIDEYRPGIWSKTYPDDVVEMLVASPPLSEKEMQDVALELAKGEYQEDEWSRE